MQYSLTITGNGIRPEELEVARSTYIDTLRSLLGGDAGIERYFRIWDKAAPVLYDGGSLPPDDAADVKVYLAATLRAEQAAADCMPDATFLDFDFEVS